MPLNIDWQQILLHLLNFTVLFAILYFLLYKPVKQFMDNRTEYYKNLDEEAKANLAEAQKTKEEYKNRLDAAEDEITQEKAKAHREIEEATAAMKKQAEKEAAKIIADARVNIENSRAKMIKEAQNEITDMVAGAAEKLAHSANTADAYDRFLETAKKGEADD